MSSAIQIFKKTVRASSGTQSNELAAKIKSVTSSTTIGAVFLYDTRNDSDGGAWRKKTSHTSWAREAASATRSSRSEFPSVALIVADNASGTKTVTIYDLDDPAMPMWMVFNGGGVVSTDGTNELFVNTQTLTSIFALNGRLSVGATGYGYHSVNFTDETVEFRENGYYRTYTGGVVNRNGGLTMSADLGSSGWLAHDAVNDIAMTVLEGAEIGALGLPIPTIAVATNGGVSVIHPNGDVYDITNSSGDSYEFTKKLSIDGNILAFVMDATGTPARDGWWFDLRTLYADTTVNSGTNAGGIGSFSKTGESGDIIFVGDNVSALAKNAIGTESGLSVYKRNDGNPDEGMVSYHTSGYCTGYQLGDIRFAGLSGSGNSGDIAADRSVKGNTLTKTGSITSTAVATSAELHAYSGFSASNYLSRANDTDFDFGDNDFSISLWVKNTNWTGDQRLLGRSESGTARRLSLYGSGTTLTIYLRDGAATSVSADVLQNNVWQHVFAFRKSSKLYLYVDGRSVGTPVASTTNITPTVASALVIGAETFDNLSSISNPLTNGSLSLVRISATAPTPTQVADIYRAEAPLFRSGAKCLLKESSGETHGSPSAVNDLSYDDSTGLLWTTQNSNLTSNSVHAFRGLERVDTFDLSAIGLAGNTQHVSAQSGIVAPVREASSGGAGVSIPAIDVRGDINTADTKLPDDGKFHFTGVTTDTTETRIGIIPLAENERCTVRAKIIGQEYNNQDGHWITVDIEREFYRDLGATSAAAQATTYKLSDASTASMYATTTLTVDGSKVLVLVTGRGSTRMQWNAEVEVQRISEKTYER